MSREIAKPFFIWVILAVVMFVAYRLCQMFEWGSSTACLGAIYLVLIAGALGFLPLVRAREGNVEGFLAGILLGAFIRFFLTAAGAVLVVLKVNIEHKWFLIWTGIFYFVYLVMETAYALSMSHKYVWKKPEFFEDDGNEINIS